MQYYKPAKDVLWSGTVLAIRLVKFLHGVEESNPLNSQIFTNVCTAPYPLPDFQLVGTFRNSAPEGHCTSTADISFPSKMSRACHMFYLCRKQMQNILSDISDFCAATFGNAPCKSSLPAGWRPMSTTLTDVHAVTMITPSGCSASPPLALGGVGPAPPTSSTLGYPGVEDWSWAGSPTRVASGGWAGRC